MPFAHLSRCSAITYPVALVALLAVAACGPAPGVGSASRRALAAASPLCGNGKLDPGEACDDGNRKAGDGCSATCAREPDLHVHALSAIVRGADVDVAGSICNKGGPAPAVRVRLLADAPAARPPCGATPGFVLGEATVTLGASACESFSVTLPGLPAGRYRIAAEIDAGCAAAEPDEANNYRVAVADVAPRQAGLRVESFSLTGSGAARRLTGRLCASGVAARDVLVAIHYDRDAPPPCGAKADLSARVTLPPATCASFDVAAPPDVWGSTRKGYLVADAGCDVTEANEADNARAWTVTGPPLLTGFVDPFIGTGGKGNTFPGPMRPFGMVQPSPDTRVRAGEVTSGYHDSDRTIVGFSQTHLSGTGIPDLRDFLFMPVVGRAIPWVPGTRARPDTGYRSRFKKSSERALPGYYRVHLDDYDVTVELTATRRAALHRYTFPKSDHAAVLIDLAHPQGELPVMLADLRVQGDRVVAGQRMTDGAANARPVYFFARFSRPFSAYELAKDGVSLGRVAVSGSTTVATTYGKNVKVKLHFKTAAKERLLVKIGISPVSVDQARKNLDAELPGWDFDGVRRAAHAEWNAVLGKIRISGTSRAIARTFYTALYHVHLGPYLLMDVDGQYFGADRKVHTASGWENYTALSLWDTFRAVHPLLNILEPRRTRSFVRTLITRQKERGLLPRWPLWGTFTWEMLGYPAVPVIVDAWRKGIAGIDASAALTAMKRTAEANDAALKEYLSLGYVSVDTDAQDAVALTLELAYEDWVIAEFAAALGKTADAAAYRRRSAVYHKVFDRLTGWMRPRRRDGTFVSPFDPSSWDIKGFSESNALHYSFSVFHDFPGLIKLMGGSAAFDRKLDRLFSPPGVSRALAPMGYYFHGNEPGHHIPYLYVYAGKPWKTQEVVRLIQIGDYSDKPNGISGNDDMGQMSAWYVFSALGFYPVTPGSLTYVIGSPLVPRAEVDLGSGKRLVIEAAGATKLDEYIQAVTLGGKPLDRAYLTHKEISAGGKLVFTMGPRPNKTWATSAASLPR